MWPSNKLNKDIPLLVGVPVIMTHRVDIHTRYLNTPVQPFNHYQISQDSEHDEAKNSIGRFHIHQT